MTNSKTSRTTKPKARSTPAPAPKRRIERDALYGATDLRAITGLGERTIYAILRTVRDQPQARTRRKYLVTGAEFLALRAAYYGYADVA